TTLTAHTDLAATTAPNGKQKHQKIRGGKQIKPAKMQSGELKGLVSIERQLLRHQPARNHKQNQQNERAIENPTGAVIHGKSDNLEVRVFQPHSSGIGGQFRTAPGREIKKPRED